MDKNKGGSFFLVGLILAVLITVLLVVFIGKKDLDEVKDMQEQINTAEETAGDMSDAINNMNQGLQDPYDDIDEAVGN